MAETNQWHVRHLLSVRPFLTFNVLPTRSRRVADHETDARPGEAPSVNGIGSPSILIAIHDGDLRHYVERTLKRMQEPRRYRVTHTGSASVAMELASGTTPSMVVIDEDLPSFEERHLVEHLIWDRVTSSLATLLLSSPDGSAHLRGMVSRVLPKPFNAGMLVQAVRAVLEGGSSGRDRGRSGLR